MQVEQRHADAAAALWLDIVHKEREPEYACNSDAWHKLYAETFARFEDSLSPSAPVDRDALPTDRYGETALDRLTDRAENGTMNPQLRSDLRTLLALTTPSVLAESTSNDCLLVAEAGELRKALEQAQNTFEQIGLVAQGCASTHGDPGGGLEMIAGYGFDGFEITHAALSRTPAVTDLSGVGVG